MIDKLDKIKDIDVNEIESFPDMLDAMGEMGGFNASLTNDGYKIIKNMVNDSQCLRFLSFPAALVATGTRGILKELIKRKYFGGIISPGINLSLNTLTSRASLIPEINLKKISNVIGKISKKFARKIPGTNTSTHFWSSGISVVLHPKNPKIPAMHFNTRFICTKKNWFGGGMDVTPSLIDNKEKKYFHNELKKMCDLHNKKYYQKYKKWCDKYFYLPHRGEPRGIGGIFFDYKMDDWKKDFSFIKDVGSTFAHIVYAMVKNKMFKKWTKKEKEIQLLKRGRYVEFNLLYDRGTKFGLNSGGNPEAILMSMPPSVKWK